MASFKCRATAGSLRAHRCAGRHAVVRYVLGLRNLFDLPAIESSRW